MSDTKARLQNPDAKPERLGAVERVKQFRAEYGEWSAAQVVRLIQEAEDALRGEMKKGVGEAEIAICDEMREAMDCGHEQACYRNYAHDGSTVEIEEWCTACRAQAQAVEKARQEALEECKAIALNQDLKVRDPDHPAEFMGPETVTQEAIVEEIQGLMG